MPRVSPGAAEEGEGRERRENWGRGETGVEQAGRDGARREDGAGLNDAAVPPPQTSPHITHITCHTSAVTRVTCDGEKRHPTVTRRLNTDPRATIRQTSSHHRPETARAVGSPPTPPQKQSRQRRPNSSSGGDATTAKTAPGPEHQIIINRDARRSRPFFPPNKSVA